MDSKTLWKYTGGVVLALIGIVLYLLTRNRELLAKLTVAFTAQQSAVLEEQKKQLKEENKKLDKADEELKKQNAAEKKDLSPEEIEEFYKKH